MNFSGWMCVLFCELISVSNMKIPLLLLKEGYLQSSNNHYEIHSINLNGYLSPKVYLSCSDFCTMHYIRCSWVYGLVEALWVICLLSSHQSFSSRKFIIKAIWDNKVTHFLWFWKTSEWVLFKLIGMGEFNHLMNILTHSITCSSNSWGSTCINLK